MTKTDNCFYTELFLYWIYILISEQEEQFSLALQAFLSLSLSRHAVLPSLPSQAGLSPSRPRPTAAGGRMLLSQCVGAAEDGEVCALIVGCVCAVGRSGPWEQGKQVEKALANAYCLQPGLTSISVPWDPPASR